MNRLAWLLLTMTCAPVFAFEITEQGREQGDFTVADPDAGVRTLGTVRYIIDFAAQHDSLLELGIRRAELKLPDGRPVEVYGYDWNAGIVVGAVAPVGRVSVTNVAWTKDGREALVLFHSAGNEIIAPPASDVGVFNMDKQYQPLDFTFKPIDAASINLMVGLLIDRSGSMASSMPQVIQAARTFLHNLPKTTYCIVATFNTGFDFLDIGENPAGTCLQGAQSIHDIQAEGGTNLYTVLLGAYSIAAETRKKGFEINKTKIFPKKLVVVITDGVNTETETTKEEVIKMKKESNTTTFVFWTGNYQKGHLEGIADWEITAESDIEKTLKDYFKSINLSIAGQQVLQIKQ